MNEIRNFSPNWVSPPGDTIRDVLYEKNISVQEFAILMGLSDQQTNNLLTGTKKISNKLAEKLENTIGCTKNFWMKREILFRERLVTFHYKKNIEDNTNWLKDIPVNDLVQNGWVEKQATPKQKVKDCLNFFGAPNIQSWYNRYSGILSEAAFRTSPTFHSQFGAVTVWIRQGELEGNKINCKPWNITKFRDAILEIRNSITKKKKPEDFIPELRRLCANCGVAVVVVPAPKGCTASGAALFLSSKKALIILSLRYLSDDHFWFSFFHEAAHLILHGKKDLFLDGKAIQSSKEEEEANEFAQNILIPSEFMDEFMELRVNGIEVVRFARKIGLSPGIVVGQLQHIGKLNYRQLNNLKVRYSWN